MKKKNTEKVSESVKADRKIFSLKAELVNLNQKYRRSLKVVDSLEAEREALLATKKVSIVKIDDLPKNKEASVATAVVLASDWHVSEEVRPTQVSGLNQYNLDIAKTRAENFFRRVLKLVKKEQQDVEIENLILWIGGDLISNNIHEDVAESCLLKPADEVLFAQSLLASGIQYLLDNSKLNLTIPCSSGNHGRLTQVQRIANEAGNSLEYFMYHNLARYFEKEPRVKFVVEESYHTYLEVYGYTLRFHHGHAVRYNGGVGGIFIPGYKAIAQWNKARRADWDFWGHFHSRKDGGNFLSNGSLIGWNAYAVNIKADYEPPQQTFCLIDKKRGKTVCIPVFVD